MKTAKNLKVLKQAYSEWKQERASFNLMQKLFGRHYLGLLLIIILALIVLAGCNNSKPLKPFVITEKWGMDDDLSHCAYGYRDANGQYNTFREDKNLYHVGDTIK